MNKSSNLIDYLLIIVKWRKFIFYNFIIVSFLAVILSILVPKWYRASATILPPSGDSEGFAVSSLLSNLPSIGNFDLSGISGESYIFMAILESRTVMDSVALKFNLGKLYKKKNLEETVKELRNHVNFKLNDDGTITIASEARTAWFSFGKKDNKARLLARDLANHFVYLLNQTNIRIKIIKARHFREFIETRYKQNLSDLRQAEEALNRFQKQHGAVALPEQTVAAINTLAELRANIATKEVEVNVMQKMFGPNYGHLVRAKNELTEFQKKYKELLSSDAQTSGINSDIDILLPFEKIPDLGLEYARFYRELLTQEKIKEFLLPQYEQARLQEVKDTPVVQVLDEAVTPYRKARPKRALIVILAAFFSLFFSVFLALSTERIRSARAQQTEEMKKIQWIQHQLRNDFKKLLPPGKKQLTNE